MNPATYKNLNGEPIDVTISAAARRWIHEEYTSRRTYAVLDAGKGEG